MANKEQFIKYRSSKSSMYKKVILQIAFVLIIAFIGGTISGIIYMKDKYKNVEEQIDNLNKEINNNGAVSTYAPDFEFASKKVKDVIVGISTDRNALINKVSSMCFNGIIIDDQIHILTKMDFITKNPIVENDIWVQMPSRELQPIKAKLLEKYDTGTGLAILEIEKPEQFDLQVNNFYVEDPKIADDIYVISNIFGEEHSFSEVRKGIISNLSEQVLIPTLTTDSKTMSCLAVDIGIDARDNLGLLVNVNGDILGLMYYQGVIGGVNIRSYAIPIRDVLRISYKILGKESNAYLGLPNVEVIDNDIDDPDIKQGLYIYSLDSQYGAYKAGIRVGDIIVKIGDTYTDNKNSIEDIQNMHSAGDIVDVVVVRNSKYINFKVELRDKLE